MQRPENFCTVFERPANAAAFLKGSEKYSDVNGMVMFYELPNAVLVCAEVAGLPRGNGICDNPIYAFHIHSGTECTGDETDPFAKTDGHFNPNDCPHPFHAGDMPPLFTVKGRAFLAFLTDRFTMPEILGKTVVIHSRPDDFTTQPSGNAGEKIACAVIVPSAR